MAKKRQTSKIIQALAISTLLLMAIFVLVISASHNKTKLASIPTDFSGDFNLKENIAMFEGEEIAIPKLAELDKGRQVLGTANSGEKWIEVDLSEQKLTAWEGDQLFLSTPVSTGLPWWRTPEGEFRIWIKLRYTRMEGGQGSYYYNLPNVPYVMYFENNEISGWRGYGLHGTYWHNDFGNPRSHGCVNLPTEIAKELFYWVGPILPRERGVIVSSNENPGTRIVIHE